MKRSLILILTFFHFAVNAQDVSGGIDAGLSYTNLEDNDSLQINSAFSPVLGFTVNAMLKPKFYFTVSSGFTLRNGMVISPSKKFNSLYLDLRLGLKYKPLANLAIESGVVASQFITGRVKSGFISENLSGIFLNQTNPYVGIAVDVNEKYVINARYYMPFIVFSPSNFSESNQFSYADLTLTIPINSKPKSEEVVQSKKQNKQQAEEDIKELKNGILLVTIGEDKRVKSKEVDNLLVSSFQKHYNFSRYFIVDEKDIDSLIATGKISVYENYPFLNKQTIDLTNLYWFYTTTGKNVLSKEESNESYDVNGIFIYNSKKQQLKRPFPFYMPISGGNVEVSVKSLNAELDKYYYQTVFGM